MGTELEGLCGLSLDVRELFGLAAEEAAVVGHTKLTTGHLLVAVLFVRKGLPASLTRRLALDDGLARTTLRRIVGVNDAAQFDEFRISESLGDLIEAGVERAFESGQSMLSVEMLLTIIAERWDAVDTGEDRLIYEILERLGVDEPSFAAALANLMQNA